MSRLDKKHCDKSEQSAANQEDLEFEAWLTQRVLDEAAEMIDELGEDPEMNNHNLEPTEEGFQQFLKMARAEGLVEEEEKDRKETKEESERISEMLRVADEADKGRPARDEKVVRYSGLGQKLFKGAAVAAILLIGIFGGAMTSQANRTHLMEKVDEMFGNDVNTKVNNTNDVLESSIAEEDVRQEIKKELNLEVPMFYYIPDGMIYDTYEMDKNACAAYIRYSYQGMYVYLQILENDNKTSGIYRNDQGMLLEIVSSENVNIDVELWKIEEEGDEQPIYLAQWEYKNCFYSFSGKFREEDMRKMVQKMIY